jgi:hypothetical protein
MKNALDLARKTFRKLAVFEIDPQLFVAKHPDWINADLLFECADTVEKIYWNQKLSKESYRSLEKQISADVELKEMFLSYHGPYDQFNNNQAFLPAQSHFPGAEFYPHDLTQNEFDEYVRKHQELKSPFESPYTIIRRENGDLRAVPYHVQYRKLIDRLSGLLRQASAIEKHPGFAAFLRQRSEDTQRDDYYLSEKLWVELEGNPIDIAIGPYEVYDDQLMGLKASFEAILFERDEKQSRRLYDFQHQLRSLCKPIERDLGLSLEVEETNVKLSVGNLIYAGGEARNAVPAIAFSLPNDENVIREVGSRQVILSNVLEGKFALVAKPLAVSVLFDRRQQGEISFQEFLNHTIFHEISHAIGPKRITVNGRDTTVNRCLRQYHWVLEEAKADLLGACLTLIATKNIDPVSFLTGFIGQFIRSIRFGLSDAHGRANAIQFNYFLKEGAFIVDEMAKIHVNSDRAQETLYALTRKILNLQKRGDLNQARQFVKEFCFISPTISRLQDAVKDMPIDVRIRYTTPDRFSEFSKLQEFEFVVP